MAELRGLASALGWSEVRTYIQSGNLVFQATGPRAELEKALSAAIMRHFKLKIPVVVRSDREWAGYAKANPLLGACRTEPQLVMLGLSQAKPLKSALDGILEYARGGEEIRQAGDALWIHFASGSAKSKITPSVLDRLVGSPVTLRNWRSVLKLNDMLAA